MARVSAAKSPAAALAPSDPVDELIKSIRIPPRPSLLADLQAELASIDPSPETIGRIVARDVGMSGALLKLANSSLYGGRRAKSIEQAILFLGINQVAALMTGLLARQAIPAESPALASFWDVSTRRSHAMVFLSRRLRIGAPDIAHTFGLFCDTGVPLLMGRFPDYATTFQDAGADTLRPFTAIEDERHSTSHAAIGALLARNWGLSSEVTWAILHHHDYAVIEDEHTDDLVRSLVALSLLAERAIRRYRGAMPVRPSGTRAANAPAPTSRWTKTKRPSCSTNSKKPCTTTSNSRTAAARRF
ncbi:HDOD domain-containing protein [Massilia sp. Se16.2.3]|uniref:HDOD domain-containing protein n=1 Tax=Massilia sp. Se16.2.3 TaxID=2709303 RepID=UPI0028065A2A|nr:HDOD domain-containing protein [Massilia sp. Se16.2.3]